MPTPLQFLLAGTKLRVIDVETTVSEGVRFVVALAVVEITNGEISSTHSWLLNPTVPIDARSQNIHGITDAMVAGQPTFTDKADDIHQVLTNDNSGDVVWVAHNAAFDVRALRREYDRSELDWVNLPILDTLTLPEALGNKPLSRLKLPVLAEKLGVSGLKHHDPVSDATITAHILLQLLATAHQSGITDLSGLLSVHGHKTTMTLCDGMGEIDQEIPFSHPTQPDTHTAQHLTGVPDNSSEQIRVWADQFLTCAGLGCEYVRDLATMIEPFPGKFMERLRDRMNRKDYGWLTTNTALGAIQPLIAGKAVDSQEVFTWHKELTRYGTRTCVADALSCPDCRESKPCPADVFYQTVAQVIDGTAAKGYVPDYEVSWYASGKQIGSWCRRGGAKIAGFVIWECIEQAAANGDKAAASKLRAVATQHSLETVEPRLALLTATRLLAEGRKVQAQDLVQLVLQHSNTDPGYTQLRDFQTSHLYDPPEPVPYPIKTQPRTGTRVRRPAGRTETPRFRL